MMRFVHRTIGKWFAAALLTLAIGLQVVEATGRWDRTFQDTGDEVVIVAVVLCIGAALVFATVARPHMSLSVIGAAVVVRLTAAFEAVAPPGARSLASTSPPLSLRI